LKVFLKAFLKVFLKVFLKTQLWLLRRFFGGFQKIVIYLPKFNGGFERVTTIFSLVISGFWVAKRCIEV